MVKKLNIACEVLGIVAAMMSVVMVVTHNMPDAIYCLVFAVWIRGEFFDVGASRVGMRGGHMVDPGHPPVRRPGNFPKKG